MGKDEFDIAERQWAEKFQARLRDLQGERRDGDMAELLGVNVDRYKKWKNRPKSQFPAFLLPKLCKIFGVSIEFMIGVPTEQKQARAPAASKRRPAA